MCRISGAVLSAASGVWGVRIRAGTGREQAWGRVGRGEQGQLDRAGLGLASGGLVPVPSPAQSG